MSDSNGGQRVLRSRDLLREQSVSDPQISPDGSRVAWVKTRIDTDQNVYFSDLLLSPVAGAASGTGSGSDDGSVALTSGDTRDTQPRWSPDGRRLSYTSGGQLHVRDLESGQVRPLTDFRYGVQDHVWSPDGKTIACVTRIDPAKGIEPQGDPEAESSDPYVRFNSDVVIARRLRWKADGVGYMGELRHHLVLIAAGGGNRIPPARLLTSGKFDLQGPAWDPQSRTLAVIGNVNENADHVRREFVYIIDTHSEGVQTPQELFGLEDIRDPRLSWSPDGRSLALCGHDDPAVGHYGNQQLWVVSVAGGKASCLTENVDRTFSGGPRWLPDGSGLLIVLTDRYTVRLAHVPAEDGQVTPFTPEGLTVGAFSGDAAGRTAAFIAGEPLSPGDIHTVAVTPAAPEPARRLTRAHDEFLAGVKLSEPEHFQFDSEGFTIDGWVLPPVDREPGQRYPAILTHGGGPGGMRTAEFLFDQQVFAARGYAVVYFNTRGCQGYGQDFCTAIMGSWGGADYVDNLNGMEEACRRFDFIDPDRLGTTGGSYGGYQVNWIIGHTDRFKAAVSDRSVFNRYSSYGTSDIMPQREFEFDGGPPWEQPEAYLRQSPLRHIGNARTPTLVVHSADDHRCPVEQGEQLYTALQRLGVPTELVRFPNESHGLSRNGQPWHRVFRLDCYLDWFKRYL